MPLLNAYPLIAEGGRGARGGAAAALPELLERVSQGIYPVVGDRLQFVEFTAIHPVGTFNDYINHKGRKIPHYPTPSRRALTYHQRTKTVDHIPTVAVYPVPGRLNPPRYSHNRWR